MEQPLFRQEAVDYQGERLWGDLILSLPVSYYLITGFLVAITAIAITFLVLNDYHRKQNVSGMLLPDKGIIPVYPPQPGLLTNLYVKEGGFVVEGDVLFRLQIDQRTSNSTYVSTQIIEELEKQEVILKYKKKLEEEYLSAESAGYDEKINKLHHEISQIEKMVKIQKQLESIELDTYMRAQTLFSQGTISQSDIDGTYKNYLEEKKILENLTLQLRTKKSDLEDTKLERSSLIISNKRSLSNIETDLLELYKQKVRVEGEVFNTIRSPVTGQVTIILPGLGQKVVPQESVLTILPQGSSLEAHLYIPTRAIGFIDTGQLVNIRYEAFPYQRFGLYRAKIKQVSKSILLRESLPIGITTNEPAYKVTASLENQSIKAYGKEISLIPGMMLTADVVLEERTLFEWLFEPLYSITGKY